MVETTKYEEDVTMEKLYCVVGGRGDGEKQKCIRQA
jgi:hypothetical protein